MISTRSNKIDEIVVPDEIETYVSMPSCLLQGCSNDLIIFRADGGNHFTHYGIYEGMFLIFDVSKDFKDGHLSCYLNNSGDDRPKFKVSDKPLDGYRHLGRLVASMKNAKQYGLATRTDDEKLIGARIDAVIPELRLAFAFSQKGTDREAKVAEVLHFLCKAKRIQLFVIRQKDPIALATEIKQAFAKANLFINSDSQRDVAHLRKRYFAQKNNGN